MTCRLKKLADPKPAPPASESFRLIENELAGALRRAQAGASTEEIAGRLQVAQTIAIVAGAYANRRERGETFEPNIAQ